MKKLFFILSVLFCAVTSMAQTTVPGTTYKLPYNNVIVKPPTGHSILQADKGNFTDSLWHQITIATNDSSKLAATTEWVKRQSFGGNTLPGTPNRSVQINGNGAFHGTDSLLYSNGVLNNTGRSITGTFTGSGSATAIVVGIGTNSILNVGPANYNFSSAAGNNLIAIDSPVTQDWHTFPRSIGNNLVRTMYMGASGLEERFQSGNGAIWNIGLYDSTNFNPQNIDGATAFNNTLAFGRWSGTPAGRSVVMTGTAANDAISANFSQLYITGGDATNRFYLRGGVCLNCGYVISSNGSQADTIENIYGSRLTSAAGSTPKMLHVYGLFGDGMGFAGNHVDSLYDVYLQSNINGLVSRAFFGGFTSFGLDNIQSGAHTAASHTVEIRGTLQFQDGNQNNGYVLTSDASGVATWQASSGGTVTSVSGTTNRITSTGGSTPVIDISASYVGQSSITTLGTIGTGTWQGTLVAGQYGGTGVSNTGKTITLGGNLTTSGAFGSTFTMTGTTTVTFPTSGTLTTTATRLDQFAAPNTDVSWASNKITSLLDPTSAQDAATKNYVDNAISGTDFKDASNYSSTAALPTVVYNNGSSGVGATLTGAGVGALSLDGNSPIVGNRILIKNQVDQTQNGIYTVTATGSGIAVFVMTRTTDFNQTSNIKAGDATYIISGTTNTGTTWVMTTTGTITVGSSNIVFAQVSGPGVGVSTVSGTTNRITSTGGGNPVIDISATFEALLGKVANPLSQFASTTSAQLAGVLSDETGTGVTVFSTTPTLVTPVLGVATATSINKVTITAPATSSTITVADGSSLITSGAFALTLTSSATSNATIPAGTNTLYSTLSGSITSAQLATSLTNETGTGVSVFSADPALTGVPTAPTATAGDNSTQIATTAYVLANYSFQSISTYAGAFSPSDAQVFYFGVMQYTISPSGAAAKRLYKVPVNCTLVGYIIGTAAGNTPTQETSTVAIRINNTTDVTLSSAVTFDAVANTSDLFSSMGLSTSMTAGDTYEIKVTSATWATNPTGTQMTVTLFFRAR